MNKQRQKLKEKFLKNYNSREGQKFRLLQRKEDQEFKKEKKELYQKIVSTSDDIINSEDEVETTNEQLGDFKDLKNKLIIEKLKQNAELIKALEAEYAAKEKERQNIQENLNADA